MASARAGVGPRARAGVRAREDPLAHEHPTSLSAKSITVRVRSQFSTRVWYQRSCCCA